MKVLKDRGEGELSIRSIQRTGEKGIINVVERCMNL